MTKRDRSPLLHLWFPNIFEFKGGIQVYSAFLLSALQKLYPDWEYEVFLKLDQQTNPALQFLPKTRFYFAGAVPSPLRTFIYALQLLIYGIWKRPDLILVTHVNIAVAAIILKRLTGIPYWVIVHGIEVWDMERWDLKQALQTADSVISVSHYTRDRLLKEQNLDPNRVLLLPNTFDSSRFQIAPKPDYLLKRYGFSADQKLILTVARLSSEDRYKGYDRILEALPIIRQQIPNVHYLLVGKGPDRDRIEQRIREMKLEDCITLAGFIPDEELGDYYNLCDVFAMPSKGEGFGIVYLEALACGKPTLGGDRDGALDALCQGILGALVNPDDVEAIATTLTALLQQTYPNPLFYQPHALRQKTIETFGFEQFMRNLAEICQSSQCLMVPLSK